jgi:polysaccharide biosynthesis protein PslG
LSTWRSPSAVWVRRPVGILALALASLACSLLIAPAATGASDATSASVHKPSKVKRKGRVVVFDLSGPIDSGTLKLRNKRKPLGSKTLSRAERRGELKTKLPGRWLSRVAKPKRGKLARKTRLEVTVESPESEPRPPQPKPSGGAVGSGLRVGLITNAQGQDMNSSTVLDKAQPTGAKWLREDFEWSVVEPQDDQWKWSRYDNLLIEAANRDVRILPVLIGTPSWAGSAWNEIPADPSEYAEYVAKLVERYGPGGSFWQAHPDIATFAPEYFELWNEPYLGVFSAGNVDPGRYARLVKAAAGAGHSSNPQAKYLVAADLGPTGDRRTFIDGMYSAVPDLNSYFDAVAVHPYTTGHSPDDVYGGWGFPRLADIRAKFVDHGAQDKPLWITEIGWSTCPSHPNCVSEQNQADYLRRMFELVRTNYSDYVRAAFVYCRADLSFNDPSDPEDWFGLQRLDGSHKPAYDAFRQAAGGA